MDERYTLLIQKAGGSVIDTFTQWGIVCCSVPFKAGGTTKKLPVRTWYDEHGDDTYIPRQLKMEAYDAEFEMAYKGLELATQPFNLSHAFVQINAFLEWLSGNDGAGGNGAEISIYSPYAGIGRQGCYLSKISDESPHLQVAQERGNVYNETIVTFKVTFRVTDPVTNITLLRDGQ